MFAENPKSWPLRKLKYVARVQSSNVDKKSEPQEVRVRLCNYTDVYYHEKLVDALPLMEATATPEEIRRFGVRPGDVLITKDSETWNDIGVPALVAEPIESGVCGYHLAQLRPDPDVIEGAYLSRVLSASGVREQFHVRANGITRFGLTLDGMSETLVPVPPLATQRTIVTFLDRETARIDSLIEKKRRLLDLLDEKRTALVTRAVTRGLDPNVPMKDSGVEWLGEVPEHWEVKRIKRLCIVRRGASPRPIDDPIYFDDEGEYAWVRIADVTASERYLEATTQRLSNLGRSKSVALEPGELFVSIAATVGKPIITKIKCCIHDGFVYFVGLRENREYLYYVFSCGEPYKGLGKLGTQLNLNTATIGNIYFPRPSPKEQEAIVRLLDRETMRIDALLGRAHHAISLLNEYRTALISAAVTGQIDLREDAA